MKVLPKATEFKTSVNVPHRCSHLVGLTRSVGADLRSSTAACAFGSSFDGAVQALRRANAAARDMCADASRATAEPQQHKSSRLTRYTVLIRL